MAGRQPSHGRTAHAVSKAAVASNKKRELAPTAICWSKARLERTASLVPGFKLEEELKPDLRAGSFDLGGDVVEFVFLNVVEPLAENPNHFEIDENSGLGA